MDRRGRRPTASAPMWEAGQAARRRQRVALLDVDWPTDLCGGQHARRHLFQPQRAALHRQAVAATARRAAGGRRDAAGQDHHGQSGEPTGVAHGGLRTGNLESGTAEKQGAVMDGLKRETERSINR